MVLQTYLRTDTRTIPKKLFLETRNFKIFKTEISKFNWYSSQNIFRMSLTNTKTKTIIVEKKLTRTCKIETDFRLCFKITKIKYT